MPILECNRMDNTIVHQLIFVHVAAFFSDVSPYKTTLSTHLLISYIHQSHETLKALPFHGASALVNSSTHFSTSYLGEENVNKHQCEANMTSPISISFYVEMESECIYVPAFLER